jgi:hypothetical protein
MVRNLSTASAEEHAEAEKRLAMPSSNEVDLKIVVNGQPVEVKANLHAPLRTVMEHALLKSGNSGQPIDNWELRDTGGQILDPNRKVSDFHFADNTTLFLNLKAGVGG